MPCHQQEKTTASLGWNNVHPYRFRTPAKASAATIIRRGRDLSRPLLALNKITYGNRVATVHVYRKKGSNGSDGRSSSKKSKDRAVKEDERSPSSTKTASRQQGRGPSSSTTRTVRPLQKAGTSSKPATQAPVPAPAPVVNLLDFSEPEPPQPPPPSVTPAVASAPAPISTDHMLEFHEFQSAVPAAAAAPPAAAPAVTSQQQQGGNDATQQQSAGGAGKVREKDCAFPAA